MIRKATEQDIPALKTLAAEAFGDTPAFCELSFRTFAGIDNIWLDDEDGAAAMALAVSVTLNDKPGAYLYSVATRRALRGSGRMTALLESIKRYGEEQGWAFLCLLPASDSLFEFYAQRGFETAFYRQEYTVPIRRNLLATAEFDDVTVALLPQLRKKLCSVPAVTLHQQGLVAVLTDYYSSGGCSVRNEGAYGFFRVEEDTLHFDEFFARDDRAAAALLQACREKTGCTSARILASDGGLTCYGSGRRKAYGMWYLFGEKPPVREGYIGMMLDL
ncbi:MAG: GNAT family N-acetyltransferase [Oscillospiraceae bacterium]|nr:GNAT family N-acetyltransferase [Oscillospiraceae bacterium]